MFVEITKEDIARFRSDTDKRSWDMNHHPNWFFEILPPWRNLNCFGFKIGALYFDFFKRWSGLGIFVRYKDYLFYLA